MVAVPDWLLLSAQGVHQLGAVAWVGGSIFYKFVLQRSFRKAGTDSGSIRTIGHEFGRIVRIAIAILVITGAFMAVVHLSAGGNSRVYIAILALKIALAFYMFLVVWLIGRRRRGDRSDRPKSGWRRLRGPLTSTTALLVLGIAVIALADVLGAVGGHGDGGHSHGGDSGGDEESGHSEVADEPVDHHESEEAEIEDEEELAELEEEPVIPTSEPDSSGSDGHDHDH